MSIFDEPYVHIRKTSELICMIFNTFDFQFVLNVSVYSIFIIQYFTKRLAGKNVSKMTYFVLGGTYLKSIINLHSSNFAQSGAPGESCQPIFCISWLLPEFWHNTWSRTVWRGCWMKATQMERSVQSAANVVLTGDLICSEMRCGGNSHSYHWKWIVRCSTTTDTTQPCIPPQLLNRVPALARGNLGLPTWWNKAVCVKESKGKEEYLYGTIYTTCSLKALRRRSHTFTCKLRHACLSFVSVHQMAPPLTVVADIQL